jgi:hypothetical protein
MITRGYSSRLLAKPVIGESVNAEVHDISITMKEPTITFNVRSDGVNLFLLICMFVV